MHTTKNSGNIVDWDSHVWEEWWLVVDVVGVIIVVAVVDEVVFVLEGVAPHLIAHLRPLAPVFLQP